MKKYLPLLLKIIISALFLLSAVAKMFPIWAFEKQLVDLGITDWCMAPYLSRLIIAFEGAIAIAVLQRNYLKSIVIPVTILLLVAFCIHLGIQMAEHGAMNGNCGCFGQLIPMTPLEAFIKNLLTIAMLVYLFKLEKDKEPGQNKFIYLLFIYFVSAFLMFFFFPFCPCKPETPVINSPLPLIDSATSSIKDTTAVDAVAVASIGSSQKSKDTMKTKPGASVDSVPKNLGPAKVNSKFTPYSDFNGTKVDLNDGKKIVCLFVPGCDHCRDAAKELVSLRKKIKLPPVYVLFMNEEVFKISEFFSEVKSSFPYLVIDDIPAFFKLLGNNASTPGVYYLWNGNIIQSYQGIESEKFNAVGLMQSIQRP